MRDPLYKFIVCLEVVNSSIICEFWQLMQLHAELILRQCVFCFSCLFLKGKGHLSGDVP